MTLASDRQTELALKARDDREALAELVIDVTVSVWSIIHKKMSGRSEEDKEDIYQEIMFQLCRNIHTFKGQSSFFTWFWHIKQNKIADYYRKQWRNKVILMADPIDNVATVNPEWYSIYDELLPICRDDYIQILHDKVETGYTFTELAERDDKSYDATRSIYRRAKAEIRRAYDHLYPS